MSAIRFDGLVPLPTLGGDQLAATGVRALENFSDLVSGCRSWMNIARAQRLDIAEGFLDLVVLRPELPTGFEFTGISLWEFRAALISNRADIDGGVWLDALKSVTMLELHAAVRQRIGTLPTGVCVQHVDQWLPKLFAGAPYVPVPEPLARFMVMSAIGWNVPKRSRYLVELIRAAGSPRIQFPARGKRLINMPWPMQNWLCWWLYRLQPRSVNDDADDANTCINSYYEYQLALPSAEMSYYSDHFDARNIFAHFRAMAFDARDGQRVLLLDEVQSDWMRDLRLQCAGRSRRNRPVYRGQNRDEMAFAPVPDCPVADSWLELALEAFVRVGSSGGYDSIAWTPGIIQSEFNPTLPKSVATALYDQRVPRILGQLLNCDPAAPLEITYPTYKRNVLITRRSGKGYYLAGPDGETPLSADVSDTHTVLSLYRAQAIETFESLPGLPLHGAPAAYAQPENAKRPLEQPVYEERETLCG